MSCPLHAKSSLADQILDSLHRRDECGEDLRVRSIPRTSSRSKSGRPATASCFRAKMIRARHSAVLSTSPEIAACRSQRLLPICRRIGKLDSLAGPASARSGWRHAQSPFCAPLAGSDRFTRSAPDAGSTGPRVPERRATIVPRDPAHLAKHQLGCLHVIRPSQQQSCLTAPFRSARVAPTIHSLAGRMPQVIPP